MQDIRPLASLHLEGKCSCALVQLRGVYNSVRRARPRALGHQEQSRRCYLFHVATLRYRGLPTAHLMPRSSRCEVLQAILWPCPFSVSLHRNDRHLRSLSLFSHRGSSTLILLIKLSATAWGRAGRISAPARAYMTAAAPVVWKYCPKMVI